MSFVVLVAPPFLSSLRPSMGLSALQGELRARDVRCETWYVNLDFAARLGVRLFEWFVSSPNNLLLGEWVFSHLIRGGTPDTRNDGWADAAHACMAAHYSAGPDAIRRARSLAGPFVEDTARSIVRARPDIVGFSTTFQQNCASLAIAARIKELAPDIVVCFGGANCARPMGEALLEFFPQIDYVFSGEADVAFPDFVPRLDRERPPRQVIDCEPVAHLDGLAMPVVDDFVAAFAAAGIDHIVWPVLVVESSRGCWWGERNHCRFCGINDQTIPYRRKSPERVAAELRALAARHGIRVFAAVDNILPSGTAGSRLLAAIANIDPPLSLFFEVKANTRREQLVEMARAGVARVQPGIESLDDDLLSLLRKGVSGLQNVTFLRNCREIGIQPTWNVLYQIPGESLRSYDYMAAIIPFLEHLPPPLRESRIRLDRFSPFFEQASEYGYSNRPFPGYEQVYGLDEERVTRLATFFRAEARNVLPEKAMEPVKVALEQWRERFQNGQTVLAIVPAGDGAMIVDTRAVARKRFASIDATAVQVLEAFRSPAAIDEVAARFGRQPIDTLIDAGYIIASRDGRRASTIVCDPSQRLLEESAVVRGGSYVFRAGLPLVEAERPLQHKVDLLAALWICGDDEPYTANPQLLPLLRDFDPLHSHEARAAFDRIRYRVGRDAMIKLLTRHTCGQQLDPDAEALAFIEALNDLDDLYGAQFAARLAPERAAMREAVARLTAGIDAVSDLAAITGSRCELDIAFCPSLFLPPPQKGRHGATVRDDGRTVVFLYFGFPLAEDLARFGVDRGFFNGGAQSYAIRVWLEPRWRRLAEDLASRTSLRDALTPHLRVGERWPDLVRTNLGIALRGKLAEREGVPRATFRHAVLGARAPLFDWFVGWLDAAGAPLDAALPSLADAAERDAGELAAMLDHRARPDTINAALFACTEPPTLVIPDTWDEPTVAMAERAWSAIGAVTLRVSQWMISERAVHAPVIAVGNAQENPIVASVLRRRPVEVPPNLSAAVVLSFYDGGDGPWTLAVAADDPEQAARVGVEIAAQVQGPCAVLDAAQPVFSGRNA